MIAPPPWSPMIDPPLLSVEDTDPDEVIHLMLLHPERYALGIIRAPGAVIVTTDSGA